MENIDRETAQELQAAQEGRRVSGSLQFAIADLLLVTTIIGMLLGAFAVSPMLSVGLFALALTALVRTSIVLAVQRSRQSNGKSGAFWLEFFASIAIVLIASVLVAAVLFVGLLLAFAFAGHVGPPIPDPAMWPIWLSFLAGAIVAGMIFWYTRNVTKGIE